MLRFLRISHLAVIDSVEVEFDAGLTVLTGETGAGKSILVEAVGLLLGGRASGDLVRTGEDSASIEAIFESGADELVVRREVTAQGRSRAFVNGSLATAGQLKELASRLIEIHGQHEHHTLLDPATHLAVIDAYGQHDANLAPVREAFAAMVQRREEKSALEAAMRDRDARRELLAFQLGELDRAGLRSMAPGDAGEDVELAAIRQVLVNAERIERLCAESYSALYDSDAAVLASLGHVWRRVGELATIDAQFQPYVDSRDAIKSQLEDLALFLRRYQEQVDASPSRLQHVEERLAQLDRLKRKYGPTLADVIGRRDALRRELESVENGGERLVELDRQATAARGLYLSAAKELSRLRRSAGLRFARGLESLLGELAMERTRFDVRWGEDEPPESTWTAEGIDQAEFYVSPNLGEDLRPLARIVSGGELSRIMLAIKTLTFGARLAERDGREPGSGAPGLIFDEVDAGIGGRVADVVGRKLRALGSAFQVLCITHLPQIAAYADTHIHIRKDVQRGRTRTSVERLDAERRVHELARMLGGEVVTDGLRQSAREMLRERAGARPGESERAKAKVSKKAGR